MKFCLSLAINNKDNSEFKTMKNSMETTRTIIEMPILHILIKKEIVESHYCYFYEKTWILKSKDREGLLEILFLQNYSPSETKIPPPPLSSLEVNLFCCLNIKYFHFDGFFLILLLIFVTKIKMSALPFSLAFLKGKKNRKICIIKLVSSPFLF